ncbi:TPA: Ail/Lom family outer membrane beta-barrel protein [Escherichia coli]
MYAITAVQHVPEKEAIVDNGAHFDGDQSGTVNGVTPPAVQHLTAEVTADSGEYQVLARWDTPKVVKGVSFMLRLTVAADDGSERLVSTARTTETTYRFRQLALGRYTLTVRAVNARGQQGDPASVSFRIAAPAAPSRIELTPGYFQITATPHLAVYDPTVQFEFWFSETRITDIRQVETTARYLGTGLYWIAASYAGDKNRQLTRYSDTRWHEDSVRNRWFSVMAGPSVRVNEWFSAYAMAGVAYSRVSTFSGDYLRVTDNKGKTHDVLTGSDDGRHSDTSLAWGAGVQFNPTESVAIDIAYEGSGSGDWRTDGFIVGVGYKF